MARDLQQETPPHTGQVPPREAPSGHHGGSPAFRLVLIGLGIALALVVIEGLAWIINPLHLFGTASHTIPALFSLLAHTPLLLLIPALELVAGVALALLLTRPLALRHYCKDAWQAGEHFRATRTSLPNWPSLYEMMVSYYQYTPDPALPLLVRERSLLDLLRGSPLAAEPQSHLVLLGEAGSGKTNALYCSQFYALQQRRDILFGRKKVPIYVPLRNYALYLRASGQHDAAGTTPQPAADAARLLNYLYYSDLPGIHHLRPYLSRLAGQGRLLLLCDGLHDVEESDRPGVVFELADLMSQERNRVILTCRAVDLRRQPALAEAIEANLVPRGYLQHLKKEQMRAFVEHYIEGDGAGKRWRHTAGQVMDLIERTRLQTYCETPLLLLSLLSVIDGMGMERGKRLDTRGRLLRASVGQRIAQTQRQSSWSGHAPTEREALLFLGEIACAARWSNVASAIQLHEKTHLLGKWLPSLEHHAGALHAWLEARADEMFMSDSLHDQYSHEEVARLLQFTLDSGLIEVSPHGILNFRHELIASYAIAEYFIALQTSSDTTLQKTRFAGLLSQALKSQDSSDAFIRWSTPLALWAGLLEEPATYAARFVEYAQDHPGAAQEALSLSLLCLGVAASPPHLSASSPAGPSNLEASLSRTAQDGEQRGALARLFTRQAEEGAYEIYQSLFALLMVAGIDDFVALLDKEIVAPLLVRRLVEIVNDVEYEGQVIRLARIIGSLGAAAVPLVTPLSEAGAGQSLRLRSAAINVLGGTGDDNAVAPLIDCLHDTDGFIVNRAASALYRLGPTLAFPALIAELENNAPGARPHQVSIMALRIVERFLDDDPARQLKPAKRQHAMAVLMNMLNRAYAPEIQEKAREMLVRQGQMAGERAGGEMAVAALIQNLSAGDDRLARTAISALCEIGPPATPGLLQQLRQQPSELVVARIVETLGRIRDPRALSPLLRLLADPSLMVQQQVAQALVQYGDESIPGLIYQVLQGENELVATSAEQILGDLGEAAVFPVMEALIPVVPGRTHLLVHVLTRLHDPQSVLPLVALLETAHTETPIDTQLVLALIEALGQFQDERVVAPLIEMLTSANPLFYEGAINALSSLETIACPELVAALDIERETALTTRIERALLGMTHFPAECLLDAFASGTAAQARHVMHVFVADGAEAAQVVVNNLYHPDQRVQMHMRKAAELMPGQVIVPALLDAIDHPDHGMRAVVAEYLLKHPHEAIPLLVSMLQEDERGSVAQRLLLDFGLAILPSLIPGLDSLSDLARERSRQLVIELARQMPEALRQVLQLFTLSPPQRAHQALVGALADDLGDISVPLLLDGLEDAHLIGAVSETLGWMVKKGDARSPLILDELLAALRLEARRQGAEIALVDIGAEAVPAVGSLITDPNLRVARAAQDILCQIGVPAFAFIWAAHSDVTNRPRREAARAIFRRMPTVVIKDELVQLLSSDAPEDMSMALALLLERIHDEALLTEQGHEMIPVLLEYVQTHADERAGHRVLALLLLLGGRTVVDYITQVLYEYPNHQERLLYSLLLLGEEAEESLLETLHDINAPALLRAEAAGMLGLLAPHVDIREYARMLPEYGLWAGQSQGQHGVLRPDHLNLSLRALGGLLAGGHWHAGELDKLRSQSKSDSPEHELYAILLGWRYHPYIAMLEQELHNEREEHKRRVTVLTQEILNLRMTSADLEEQLENLQHEHGKRGQELDEATQTISDLQDRHDRTAQERDQMQQTLLNQRRENQSLQERIQQVTQEKQHIAGRLAKLEQDLRAIGGLGEKDQKKH